MQHTLTKTIKLCCDWQQYVCRFVLFQRSAVPQHDFCRHCEVTAHM